MSSNQAFAYVVPMCSTLLCPVRAIEGAIGISDFDDTLYVSGGLNQRVYDFIDSQDVDLVVVTGRHEAIS